MMGDMPFERADLVEAEVRVTMMRGSWGSRSASVNYSTSRQTLGVGKTFANTPGPPCHRGRLKFLQLDR